MSTQSGAVECRPATLRDRPALMGLWQAVFGDEDAFIRRCLDDFSGPGGVYVVQMDGQLAAMLLAAPCMLCGAPGAYLYALATQHRQRGAGVMSALMAHAEAALVRQGAQFGALIPASEPLYSFYRKRGYNCCVLLRHLQADPLPKRGNATLCRPAAGWLQAVRRQYLKAPMVEFDTPRLSCITDDLAGEGFTAAEAAGAYALYRKSENRLLVAELGAKTDGAANALLAHLLYREGLAKAELTLPQASGLFVGLGVLREAALLKQFSPAFHVQAPYLRFGFDKPENGFGG